MSYCLPTAKAGAAYFAIVFGIALALGTFRVFVLTPMLGAEFAVAAEIPIVLGVSWVPAGGQSGAFRCLLISLSAR